ncbi:unnamed protein product [Parnassius apollo]|uniref:(apollo) hypothetical protein n=1 Tax=Parnassius apollo TaxID=110799 RepID=A0A8S3Y8G2_PARAO|nr:unnamed protein product [Parnassius apollo]
MIIAKKTLSSAQIQNYLTIPLGSEDEQDSSDAENDDDIDVIRSTVNKLCETFNDTDDEEESVSLNKYEFASPLSGSCGSDMQQHNQILVVQFLMSQVHLGQLLREHVIEQLYLPRLLCQKTLLLLLLYPSSEKSEISSGEKHFHLTNREFCGQTDLEPPITELETPLQYFLYFFDDDFLSHIVEEMHKFSVQKNPSKPFSTSVTELKKYIGICLLMGIAPLPHTRMYWETELGLPLIRNTMSVNQFEKIRQYLHFNDNTTQSPAGIATHDRLHKIRPVLETLKKCHRYRLPSNCSQLQSPYGWS